MHYVCLYCSLEFDVTPDMDKSLTHNCKPPLEVKHKTVSPGVIYKGDGWTGGAKSK